MELKAMINNNGEAYQRFLTENQQLRQSVADFSSASSDETWLQIPRPYGKALCGSSIIRRI